MPLIELGAHYAVTVKINDIARPMIVDTGAEVTLFKLSAADELKLARDPSVANLKPMVGIGQTTAEVHPNVIPSVLAFGDLVYRDRSTAVAEIDDGKLPESDSVGLLGDDILSQFDVEFDFPSRKMTFYRASGCYGTFSPWSGNYSAMPFDHRSAKVTVDVFFNAERTRTIVDTGNNGSFVSRSSTALSDVSDSELEDTNEISRSPLNDGTPFPVMKYTFDRMKIGDESFSQRKMNVVDVDFPLGSANLGLDYWRTRKIWFSYRNGWMFVSESPATTALAYPVKEAEPAVAEADIKNAPGKKLALAKIVATSAPAPEKQ